MSNTTATHTIRRIHSTQTERLREDLATALDLVMELADAVPEDRIAAAAIVADLYHPHDKRAEEVPSSISPYDALRRVRKEFGKKAFGVVTLFSIEAETSLARDCKWLLNKQALASMDMTVRDLGWPQDMLPSFYSNEGRPWSEYEHITFSTAVENWKQAHPDDTTPERTPRS